MTEEEDDPIVIEQEYRGGYAVVFDPLDGSSNIECGVSIGAPASSRGSLQRRSLRARATASGGGRRAHCAMQGPEKTPAGCFAGTIFGIYHTGTNKTPHELLKGILKASLLQRRDTACTPLPRG